MTGTLFFLQARPAAILALDPDSGEVRTILADVSGVPDGIQVDGPGRMLYWTNMGAWPESGEDFLSADGAIERCTLGGSDHQILVGDGAIVTPKQIQLDGPAGMLYWCDREGMALFRCRTDGSNLTALLRTGIWPDEAKDVMRHCVGIALDIPNGFVYWTQKGPPDGGLGRIFRMPIEMPSGATAATRGDRELLIDRLPEPIDLEIDHARGQLFWTDRGDPAFQGNSLNRADITSSGLANRQVVATGLKEGIGLSLDSAGRRAFIADLSGAIRMFDLDDEVLTTIHECGAPITGLAFCRED